MRGRRDFIGIALGAVLGGVVTLGIEAFQENSPGLLVLGACAIILGWLTFVSIRLLGPPRLVFASTQGIDVDGVWNGVFSYVKDGQTVRIHEKITITQRGRLITGTSISTNIEGNFPFTSTSYRFVATLRVDGVVDGTWKTIEGGRRYHGSLQALASRKGNSIEGNWIGVDDTGLRLGEFRWTRTA